MRCGLRRASALCLLAVLLAGCASFSGLDPGVDPAVAALPAAATVPDVPFFAQEDLYCGPAALAMAVAWTGLDVTQDEVAPLVYTPGRSGTLASDLVTGARRMGRLAVPVTTLEALLAEVAAGHPVIVFQNLGLGWWPVWHFAVVTGYDLFDDRLILHSGTTADLALDRALFERTWARADNWGLVVLPPDRLPAIADERAVLEAAVALERAGQPAAAYEAYRAALDRWPESLPGWIGLGNTAYAMGDLARSEAAFDAATRLFPNQPAGWQNLAVVRESRGDLAGAAEAADRAARLQPERPPAAGPG